MKVYNVEFADNGGFNVSVWIYGSDIVISKEWFKRQSKLNEYIKELETKGVMSLENYINIWWKKKRSFEIKSGIFKHELSKCDSIVEIVSINKRNIKKYIRSLEGYFLAKYDNLGNVINISLNYLDKETDINIDFSYNF